MNVMVDFNTINPAAPRSEGRTSRFYLTLPARLKKSRGKKANDISDYETHKVYQISDLHLTGGET